jgi:hypothetical protein
VALSVGDTIPNVKLMILTTQGPTPVQSAEVLGQGKIVLFAVPGAFTPTCNDHHLPGFVMQADEILAKGVDRIACVAVNDAFVMGAWGNGCWGWTSTPGISQPWSWTLLEIRWGRRCRSRSSWRGVRALTATGGSGPRSPHCWRGPRPPAARRWSSKISTSRRPAPKARTIARSAVPTGVDEAALSGACWRGCPPAGFATGSSRWPATRVWR